VAVSEKPPCQINKPARTQRFASFGNRSYITAMKLRLLVELDPETNRWSAVFPELPGCASAGDTEAEAVANAKEALALWFEPAPVKMNKGAKMMELAVS
jgi:predicted RNase H-like HicB family nuclease